MQNNFVPLSSVTSEGFGTLTLTGIVFPLQLNSISNIEGCCWGKGAQKNGETGTNRRNREKLRTQKSGWPGREKISPGTKEAWAICSNERKLHVKATSIIVFWVFFVCLTFLFVLFVFLKGHSKLIFATFYTWRFNCSKGCKDHFINSKEKVSSSSEMLLHISPMKDVFGNRLRVAMINACLCLVPSTHIKPESIKILQN